MSSLVFNPAMSTNEIYRDNDTSRCLTDDLDAIDAIHNALPNTYATTNHTHDGYATSNHTHNEYLVQSDISPIAITNGDDLNDIFDVGVYYRDAAASDSNVVSNTPPAMHLSTFILEVFRAGGGTQIVQRATRCHKASKAVAERTYYGGAWGDWETTYVNGKRVLWSGAKYMNASQTIELSEPISNMSNGIVLVFSGYANGAAQNTDFVSMFVPKYLVDVHGGKGHSFMLVNSNATRVGRKYLYISNNSITGNDNNVSTGDVSGITWNNNYYVLRYVLGC